MARIENMMKPPVLARASTSLSLVHDFQPNIGNDPAIIDAVEAEMAAVHEAKQFQSLQDDLNFVAVYDAEMERKCRKGVWWEGWLVVANLERRGIVGSKG